MSFLFFASLVSKADIKFTMDETRIKPLGQAELAVNVANNESFAGFELKIFLPEGISFQGTTRSKRIKASSRLDDFTITGANQSDGSYKISVANFEGESIQPGEGPLFYILIQADENATIGTGEIKLGTVRYSNDEVLHNLSDVTANIIIYDNFTITATSANEEMGSVTGGGSYDSGTTATLTATATEGYHFTKWSNDVTDNPYTFEVTTNASLTAFFVPNQYTMTFVLGNGEADVVKTQDYGSELTAPTDVQRTGYTFIGWSPEVPATVPLGNQTYTAQWGVVNYTISYDLAGGQLAEGVANPTSYNIESANITLANPTREGYTFAGWTGTELTEATQAVTISTGSTGNRSYTATWTINQYKMTFVLGNGEEDVVKIQDYGSELTAPTDVQRTGYTFIGWSPEVPATVPSSNQTFTAQWQINQYTMTFVFGEGYENVVKTQNYNTELTAPTVPERVGYTFVGWNPEVNSTVPAENKTFTAQWKANQYTVTFVLNNGSADIVYTQDYGTTIVAPEDPVKKGYTFKGWNPAVATTVPAYNLTYEATYQINTYNVIYMVYGEEWARDQYTYNSPIEIRQYVGTILDDFRGWQSDAEYTTMPDHDVTYVADITKLDPIVITSDMIQNIDDIVYTGKAIEPTIIVKNGELILVEGTDYSVNYTDNVNVGTAKVTVTAIQGSCYQGSADKTFKIVKADVIIKKAPMGLNLVYTGQPQALVEAGSVEGGTIVYSGDGETYSEDIPTGMEMQDYTVYYKIIGDANHNDVGVQTLTASIKGFTVVVEAGEFATYYCDCALKLDAAETDAKLYTVTDVKGSVVTVSELTVAGANTPLLIYNNGVEAKTVVLIPTEDAPENIAVYSGFKGTLEAQQIDGSSDVKDYYVMGGQYFTLVHNSETIAANSCWLEVNKSVSQSAPRLIISGGGDTTGINGIVNTAADNEAWYDLNGRKLGSKPAQKGVYIKNGKKVVIK